MSRSALQPEEVRHLLRRLAFTTTPDAERDLRGQSVEAAFDVLAAAARKAAPPDPPDCAKGVWTNTSFRTTRMSSAEYQTLRAAQVESNQRDITQLRQWWLRELIGGPAPLRENLVVFLHGTIGSSSGSADMPQAIHGHNALLRRSALGTIPALLEALVSDPAMMIQIGMDDYTLDKLAEKPPNFRPAKLMLDNWTVGAGEYTDADLFSLARALTGWLLVAPPGHEPKEPPDASAFTSARRAGLSPVFDRLKADDRPKTILGTTEPFDARSAVRFLARHPATARRFSRRLIEYFGVVDPAKRLEGQLVETYRATDGSIEALVKQIVRAGEFWSDDSRWSLIKSPVHLAVGACRQLEISEPPLAGIGAWLIASGQKLFDTPNFGDGGWPGQRAWVTPPDRLAVRYQLGVILSGRSPELGFTATGAAAGIGSDVPGNAVRGASTGALLARLDPAPGIDVRDLERRLPAGDAKTGASAVVRQLMATPQYQLA